MTRYRFHDQDQIFHRLRGEPQLDKDKGGVYALAHTLHRLWTYQIPLHRPERIAS